MSTGIMATYCALLAELELEADAIKNKLAVLDYGRERRITKLDIT